MVRCDIIKEIAGRIVGKNYGSFNLHAHSKYRLPVVYASGVQYSGFNMGAGESAVFSILSALFEAGKGALLVIDEIELGLHEKAQRRLIDELRKLCKELHCQIICSTHSPVILDSLPPEARFFIEPGYNCTRIIPGISADYACGKLAGASSNELDVFVEDSIGHAILTEVLPLSLRERTRIIPIGSSEAVLRQLSARYREKNENCIAFLDGDKNSEHCQSVTKIKRFLETQYDCPEIEIDRWINDRLKYLPGNTWTEKWLIELAQFYLLFEDSKLASCWGTNPTDITHFFDEAKQAEKHYEFYSLHNNLHRQTEQIRDDIIRFVKEESPSTFNDIIESIETMLN